VAREGGRGEGALVGEEGAGGSGKREAAGSGNSLEPAACKECKGYAGGCTCNPCCMLLAAAPLLAGNACIIHAYNWGCALWASHVAPVWSSS
jgi:hypothetical protein